MCEGQNIGNQLNNKLDSRVIYSITEMFYYQYGDLMYRANMSTWGTVFV